MFNNKLKPKKKMSKARTNLVLNDIFFGSLSMRLEMRAMEDWEVKQQLVIYGFATAWTDGVEIVYSEEYVKDMTFAQCKGLIAHEVAHVALKHHLRRGKRDLNIWQIACDYAIDSILVSAKYDVPDPLTNLDYDGKSAERIYALIPKKKSGQPQPQSGQPQSQSGQPQPQSGQPQSQSQSGQLPPNKSIVKDAPINLNDRKQVQKFEEQLDSAIQQAVKNAGTLPGGLDRVIKIQQEHTVDEWDILRDFMEKSVNKEDYSWTRPNRRFGECEFFMPGFDEDYDQPNIAAGVDVSGSIDDKELAMYGKKMGSILEEFQCSYTAVYFDTKIQDVQQLDSDEMPIELKSTGGGGTKFKVFFDYIKTSEIEFEAILFFTDMDAWDWNKLEDPGVPVLWMNTNRNKNKFNPPFGVVVPIET